MIVITGATGFIGRRVIKLLVKKYDPSLINCLIWEKDNDLEISGRKILQRLGVNTTKVDLVTKSNLMKIVKAPDLVIHLAGNTDTYSSNYRCNDIGTRNLLNCFKKLSKNTHFIHISTTAIMSGRLDCSKPFDEEEIPVPANNYAISKLKAESLVKAFCKKDNFKLSILRYPTVYGKDPRKNSFFDYIVNLIRHDSFFMKFNWPGLTSFVHVDDAAKAILLIAQKAPKSGHFAIYNVSSESLTLAQISKMLYKRLNLSYKVFSLPQFLWSFFRSTRKYIYKLEQFLPAPIYNSLWRATLLVDDVIYCNSSKIEKSFYQWKPLLLSDRLDDVI